MQKAVYEFISKQTNDPIIEWRVCAISGKEFPIFQSDKEFYEKISPTLGGKKYLIPFPTLCPEERQRRRLMFRNERKLYKRTCDLIGESIVTIYYPEAPYKIYSQDARWSDKRSALDYGRDFDFDKSFTEQFGKLLLAVPRTPLLNMQAENSDYCNPAVNNKDCYLIFGSTNNETCCYSKWIDNCNACIDCLVVNESEQCYECIDCTRCFACMGCSNCSFCSHCFNCYGLDSKQFYINNEQYTKDKYFEKIKQLKIGDTSSNVIHDTLHNINSSDCIGSYLVNCKGCKCSVDLRDCEDCCYTDSGKLYTKDSYDCSYYMESELGYEILSFVRQSSSISTIYCWDSSYVMYCDTCYNSSHLFGCVGLRNKQYCIFNKQYTKEKYEQKVLQIIQKMQEDGERGEFFHPSLSPFAYNESVACEFFPFTKDQAFSRGYERQDKEYPINIPIGIEVIQSQDIPKNIEDVDNSILSKAIICEISGEPFRIIKPELEFYRKHNLPIPRKHHDIRSQERLAKRPGRELFIRNCDSCDMEMLSVYRKEYEGNVYCEDCYKREVYG